MFAFRHGNEFRRWRPAPPVSATDNETITVTDTPLIVTMPALLTVTAPVAYYSVGSLGFEGQSGTLPLTVSNLGQANLSLVSVTSPASPFSIAADCLHQWGNILAHCPPGRGGLRVFDRLCGAALGDAHRHYRIY